MIETARGPNNGRSDKYTRLIDCVNAGLESTGMIAQLSYRKDDARIAPTGEIMTFLTRLDGTPVPVEYILEAMGSILNIHNPWLRIQNTGQAVTVSGCPSLSAAAGDQIWEPPSITTSLVVAKSIWISLSAVHEMKLMQKIKTSPLSALMFIHCHSGGLNSAVLRFGFRRSHSEQNVNRIVRAVYSKLDARAAVDSDQDGSKQHAKPTDSPVAPQGGVARQVEPATGASAGQSGTVNLTDSLASAFGPVSAAVHRAFHVCGATNPPQGWRLLVAGVVVTVTCQILIKVLF